MKRFGLQLTKRLSIVLGRPKRIEEPALHAHVSLFRPNIEIVKSLLADGKDVNGRNALGSTPLMLAAASGHAEIVDLLLRSGAEINAVDVNGQTALILAVGQRHLKAANVLLNAADLEVNGRTTQGMTALMYAVASGHASLARRLLAKGADPNVANSHGQSALTIAEQRKDANMLELLREYGVRSL